MSCSVTLRPALVYLQLLTPAAANPCPAGCERGFGTCDMQVRGKAVAGASLLLCSEW